MIKKMVRLILLILLPFLILIEFNLMSYGRGFQVVEYGDTIETGFPVAFISQKRLGGFTISFDSKAKLISSAPINDSLINLLFSSDLIWKEGLMLNILFWLVPIAIWVTIFRKLGKKNEEQRP